MENNNNNNNLMPMVMILISLSRYQNHSCFGYLIDNDLILSLSSCLKSYPFEKNMMKIFAIENDNNNNKQNLIPLDIKIKRTFRHPYSHNNNHYYYNIDDNINLLLLQIDHQHHHYNNESESESSSPELPLIEFNNSCTIHRHQMEQYHQQQQQQRRRSSSSSSLNLNGKLYIPNVETVFHYYHYECINSPIKCIPHINDWNEYHYYYECDNPCLYNITTNANDDDDDDINSFIGIPLMFKIWMTDNNDDNDNDDENIYNHLVAILIGKSKCNNKLLFVRIDPFVSWIQSKTNYREIISFKTAEIFWLIFIIVYNVLPIFFLLFSCRKMNG
ncbi:hypothetical protein DERF_013687 [Dermatophagoides farinae]|uniref:Peptidase S1 domain-containing protein n=1 Tax=Dermatophagoides farinae TaxID=6954 RepID=A0A922HMR0_DERFA|nr:hypothetical protein DERF_013687 [Dermatophagoides farinae]